MKRIFFLTILTFVTGLFIACNSSTSSTSTDEGYTDPEITTLKTLSVLKEYTFSGTPNFSCGPANNCATIIYKGKLSKINYVGIAADNRPLTTFKFRMYWVAESIPEGSGLTLPSCTIIINNESTSGVNVTGVTIVNNGDGTYSITLPAMSFGSVSITSANLRAYGYVD